MATLGKLHLAAAPGVELGSNGRNFRSGSTSVGVLIGAVSILDISCFEADKFLDLAIIVYGPSAVPRDQDIQYCCLQ